MKKLDLVYEICEDWANENFISFVDVTTRPDSIFYICEIDNISLLMKDLLQLTLELEKHGLEVYSIDKHSDNDYLEIWID